jgi:RND family efflux transporter MFP subunit
MSAESRPPAPPSRRNWVFLALAVALAGGGYFALKSGDKATGPRYRTTTLEKRTVIRRVEASGHLAIIRRVEVPSLLQGRMLKVNKKLKDEVKAGEVLASLEPLPTSMNADVATAQVAAASGGVAQAEVEVRALRAQLKQAESLKAKGLAGEAEVQSVRVKVEAAEAAMRAAGAQRNAAQAALTSVRRLASNADLVAPIDGVVLDAPDVEGSLVGPGSGPIFVLADTLDRLHLAAEVSELDVALLQDGQAAEITVDSHSPGERFPAKVLSVGLTPARSGAMVTYPVTFELENPGQPPAPGPVGHCPRRGRPGGGRPSPCPRPRSGSPRRTRPPAEDRARVFRLGAGGRRSRPSPVRRPG